MYVCTRAMLFVQVSLPLHLGYGVSSAAWLVVVRRAQLEYAHAPPRAGFALLAVHVCAVSVYHIGALAAFARALGGTPIQTGSASAAATVAHTARSVRLLAAVTCLQFVQSIALYTTASLLVLQMRTHAARASALWMGHLASVACVACASLLVAVALVAIETDEICTGCDFSTAHIVICCNLVLVAAAALHASTSRDLYLRAYAYAAVIPVTQARHFLL